MYCSGGRDAVPVGAVDLESAGGRDHGEADYIIGRSHWRVGCAARACARDDHVELGARARANFRRRERDMAGVVLVANLLEPASLHGGQWGRGVEDRHRAALRGPVWAADAAWRD